MKQTLAGVPARLLASASAPEATNPPDPQPTSKPHPAKVNDEEYGSTVTTGPDAVVVGTFQAR